MLKKFSSCWPSEKALAGTSSGGVLESGQSTSVTSFSLQRISELESSILSKALFYAQNGTVPKSLMVTENKKIESIDLTGDEIFASQAKLASSAREEVLIQTFAWEPSSPGAKAILDGLLEAIDARHRISASEPTAQKKLRVCILINEGTGFAEKFMKMTSANKKRGPSKRWASTPDAIVGNYKSSLDHKYSKLIEAADFQVRVHQHSSSNSLHAKSVVVDGRKSAVTGANVQSRNHGDCSCPRNSGHSDIVKLLMLQPV
ncbi:hypothetical protein HBDW_43580 [Herbaspirillum sp. DW155]|uniref:hypothetical protein n=1 Tax=Herbaspirillum sp. DW155 TaxID=3095609 RepID=UPI00308B0F98|nr:hypothetical protein HBDW_43580 [Herbaspirillum sp. DW155]